MSELGLFVERGVADFTACAYLYACVFAYLYAWVSEFEVLQKLVLVSNVRVSCGGSLVVWRSFFFHWSSLLYDLPCPPLSPPSLPLFL